MDRRFFLFFALFFAAACRTSAPDLILTNGKVFTSDASGLWAHAVAIRGDRIAAVGSSDEVAALAGAHTRVIDLKGRVVVPGINDAHVHEPWSIPGERVGVPPGATAEQILDAIAAATKRVPESRWISVSVSFNRSEDPKLSRTALDAVAPNHLVRIGNDAGHVVIFNSAALRAHGIGEHDPDPPGGHYGRTDGALDGRVFEHALWAKERRLVEEQPDETLLEHIHRFADEAIRYGITSVQSMPAIGAARMRSITPKMNVPLRWRWMDYQMMKVEENPTMPMKYVLDGTPIERGAALREGYADRAGEHGSLNYSDDQILRMVEVAARSNQQLLLHIAGDAAIEKLFQAMSQVKADWPAKRVRIEHGDFIASFLPDAKRFGVIIVQNPAHFMLGDIALARFGGPRPDFQVVRSLADEGYHLALGSDGPLNPWLNMMFAAIHPLNPAEALTREQTVIAYTRGSAYAEFREDEKGTIAPGQLADLAVLSQDVFTVPAPELPKTTSVMTIIGGNVVWQDQRADWNAGVSRQ